MDDLVVIILTLLVAGAGVIGQLKKKKQNPEATGGQKKEGDIWDLLKDEVFPVEQKVEPAPLNIEQEEFEPSKNEQGYKFEAKNEEEKLNVDTLKTISASQKKDKKIKEEFSLRKAVIYSEILNRKYN